MNVEGVRIEGSSPYAVRHDLTLTPAELEAVAGRHRGGVEAHRPDLPLVHQSGARRRVAETASGSLVEMAERGAWVTMFDVGRDPVLHPLAAELQTLLRLAGFPEAQLTLSLVCSSATGVTPAHMDVHDVLLLQLRGHKQLSTGTFTHRRDRDRELRRRFGPGRENLSRLPDEHRQWSLSPGEGVFIPAYTAHWATVGAETSVALSVGISTESLRRREAEHVADAVLLRHRVRLAAPGRFPLLDAVRLRAVRAVGSLRSRP